MSPKTKNLAYQGFEQGPIRPPSEAWSLLIRVTRNCPWNHCAFCPVYKGQKFSLRPVEHVIQDIDSIHEHLEMIKAAAGPVGQMDRTHIAALAQKIPATHLNSFQATLNWVAGGMQSIFLQDANSLVISPQNLITILNHLKARFPWVARITSYARSHTIARITDEALKAISQAGLNRIHIGLESGSDRVLKMVRKGCDKATHIKAGKKIKAAGMELSEYVMPGLGGRQLAKEHALETADALNQIDPDYIRLRTLAVPSTIPLYQALQNGNFIKCTDKMMAEEILWLLEALNGITSTVTSDHILNLFQEVEGVLPHDKAYMIKPLRDFLSMPANDQVVYQVGRRLGIFSRLDEMQDTGRRLKADQTIAQLGITPENADQVIDDMMRRFI